jgi:hypothetical protein
VVGKGFSTFRATVATLIDSENPNLTSIFLGHSEQQVKKHYVSKELDLLMASAHYQLMFDETDKLRKQFIG